MGYLYPVGAVLLVLLIAARLVRDRRYSSRLGRVDSVDWKIRQNSYFWEKRAKR